MEGELRALGLTRVTGIPSTYKAPGDSSGKHFFVDLVLTGLIIRRITPVNTTAVQAAHVVPEPPPHVLSAALLDA